MGASVRATAQNIHQMQQQHQAARLNQIQALKQQREVLRAEKEKEQKEKEHKEMELREQGEREQKEREEKEQREREQKEKEEKERQQKEEAKKKDKSNPANRKLQRPAIMRMKVNFDFGIFFSIHFVYRRSHKII
jgi:colicin import membrane protein